MMLPSEEKVRAMVNRASKALERDPDIRLLDPDGARRLLKKAIEGEVAGLEAIEATARARIGSLSRRVAEGTRDWDELFARYVGDELKRRGLR